MVMNYTTQKSADPVLLHQAIAIAEAYMEEISLKSFADPDGLPEVGRANFDDVSDYNSLPDTAVRDQTGTAIAGLGSYSVAVVVDAQNFGATGNQESGLRIRVTVTDPAGEDLTLTGYRADF
jgi:MSHA pilin protein MshD